MFHANILVQNTLSNSKEFIIGLITDFFKKNNIAQKYLDRLVEQKYFDYYVFDGYQTKIKIEDIDKIMTIINQHTHEAIGYRFIIINNITNCTIQALNKLLKIIEEPHAHTYYFFTTSNLERVLYTIRSRCFTYFLKPVSNFNRMQELTNKQQMFVCKYINDCNQIIDIDNFNNNWNIAQAIVNQQISLELINQFSLLDYQQIMIIAKIGFYLTNDTSWTSLFLPIIKNINKNLLFDQMQKIN